MKSEKEIREIFELVKREAAKCPPDEFPVTTIKEGLYRISCKKSIYSAKVAVDVLSWVLEIYEEDKK